MNRREWMGGAAALALGTAAARAQKAAAALPGGAKPVRVRVDTHSVTAKAPDDFMGLGYEVSSVPIPGLFDPENRVLLRLLRNLGSHGVIRIGGNTSDYDSFSARSAGVSSPNGTVVNEQSLEKLGRFLGASGWRLVWGLNLGSRNVEQVVAEAQAVSSHCGNSLLAFEVGNEPDLFVPAHRTAPYGYEQWYAEFRKYAGAVRARLPNASFAGPDVANKTDWVARFAHDEGKQIKLLTHHYYAEGPPQSPASTIENLLEQTSKLSNILQQLSGVSAATGIPYRICETNSCFGGGKPGVSDTFASALWGLDYLHMLADSHAAGVNIETGVNQLGFVSSYSPIVQDGQGRWGVRPLYYGLLAFVQGGMGERLHTAVEGNGVNLTAYAARLQKGSAVTLVNKDLHATAEVRIEVSGDAKLARVLRLSAPDVTSREGVTLGSETVGSDGDWRPSSGEQIRKTHGAFEIAMPRASAAVLTIAGG